MSKVDWRAFFSAGALTFLAACMGSDNDTIGDSIFSDGKILPFTDAYIVYPGPHMKWVGPDTFTIHLSAQGDDTARVTIASRILKYSGFSKTPVRSSSRNISVAAAREEIARLFIAMKPTEDAFNGCLFPVRVKIIRADGALIERQGCRGQTGWPKVASEIVNHLIESSMIPSEKGSRRLSSTVQAPVVDE